jgi:hypothetical protein
MKAFCMIAWIFAAAGIVSGGQPVPESTSKSLVVTNDGTIRSSPSRGETTWTGDIDIEHPRFRMHMRGQVSMFAGPALRKKSGAPEHLGALKASDIVVEQEWISLVAVGEITLRVVGPSGESRPVHATRVVYLPSKDQILVDGKPWIPPSKGKHLLQEGQKGRMAEERAP